MPPGFSWSSPLLLKLRYMVLYKFDCCCCCCCCLLLLLLLVLLLLSSFHRLHQHSILISTSVPEVVKLNVCLCCSIILNHQCFHLLIWPLKGHLVSHEIPSATIPKRSLLESQSDMEKLYENWPVKCKSKVVV